MIEANNVNARYLTYIEIIGYVRGTLRTRYSFLDIYICQSDIFRMNIKSKNYAVLYEDICLILYKISIFIR